MLVLTRKVNQTICLGEDIKVTVLSVEGDRVSLGVEAPRTVRIFRSELLEGTKTVNRESLISEYRTIQKIKEYRKTD